MNELCHKIIQQFLWKLFESSQQIPSYLFVSFIRINTWKFSMKIPISTSFETIKDITIIVLAVWQVHGF